VWTKQGRAAQCRVAGMDDAGREGAGLNDAGCGGVCG
jgi:hypothetical protein